MLLVCLSLNYCLDLSKTIKGLSCFCFEQSNKAEKAAEIFMAHSVLCSVCWCKCEMLLLKAVELLQIHPGAAEMRAQPSAGLLEGAAPAVAVLAECSLNPWLR